MSSPLPVRIVGSAGQAILDAAEWWVSNRTKAPDEFAIQLERAIQILAFQPLIGAEALNVKLAGVRCLHLPRVHYHLHYRVTSHPEVVEILALWHTSRGTSPNLP